MSEEQRKGCTQARRQTLTESESGCKIQKGKICSDGHIKAQKWLGERSQWQDKR